jgi:SAM-dependent methyltransferase
MRSPTDTSDPSEDDDRAADGFYRAFEERFRGSRSEVKERLTAYLPFVSPLLEIYQPTRALDLGCGRGEWLELLIEHGFEATGVDLDAGMLQACSELELPAVQGDAIAHLRSMDSESLAIVSGFHVAEHLQFPELQALVEEAHRVLLPGGLLILETPNPENIVVATLNFYTDPTHERPLPPALLAFLVEHHGFTRSKIVRLQESADLAGRQDAALLEVLSGPSPDYAVVAQKQAAADVLQQFTPAFDRQYGLDLRQLAERHDQVASLRDRIETLYAELTQVAAEGAADRARIQYLEPQLADSRESVEQLTQQLRGAEAEQARLTEQMNLAESQRRELTRRVEQTLTEAHRWQREHQAIMSSTSWRITHPLRVLKPLTVRVLGMPARLCKRLLVGTALVAIGIAIRTPGVRAMARLGIRRFPRLHSHTVAFARSRGLIPTAAAGGRTAPEAAAPALQTGVQPRSTHPLPHLPLRRQAGIHRDQMGPLERTVNGDDLP